ncbi:MAG: RBBP9/YdeN family alpha/beta hydrolase [Polynucleobacter sp.]
MMSENTLIIPGYLGSGDAHWQTWIEEQIPGAQRVEQNWDRPALTEWAYNISATLNELERPAWLVAHSFGCLASILAASENTKKVLGLMLVAPADPERFDSTGVKRWSGHGASESIRGRIPMQPLPVPSLLIASDNDPWMQASKAHLWGECWGSQTLTLKAAGHINAESGFGPWPDGLKLFNHFRTLRPLQAKELVFKGNFPLIPFNDKQSAFSCFTA